MQHIVKNIFYLISSVKTHLGTVKFKKFINGPVDATADPLLSSVFSLKKYYG